MCNNVWQCVTMCDNANSDVSIFAREWESKKRYARFSEVHTLHPRHTFFTNEHGVKSRSRLSRKIPATSWGRRRGPASHFGVLEVQLLRECVLGCGAAKASTFREGNRNHSIYFTLWSGRSYLCCFQLFFLFFSRIYSLLGIGPPMPIPQRCYWQRMNIIIRFNFYS